MSPQRKRISLSTEITKQSRKQRTPCLTIFTIGLCSLVDPSLNTTQYRDLLIVLPMREPSIFHGIAVSLLRPVIGSNDEIDVVALNWVADVRNQIAAAFK